TTQIPANVSFVVTNDWGTGFTADLTIRNTGTTPINGWTLAFNAPYNIDQAWSSTLTKLPDSRYSVNPLSWNTTIPAGGSVTFGYRGIKAAGTVATAPTNYTLNGVALTTGTTTPTVLPDLSISDATIAEGGLNTNGQASALFTVKLSKASTSPVTVSYATQNGTAIAGQDFTATQGTLTFAAGETSKTIAVPILNDTAVESTESFSILLSNATQAKIIDATGVGTITDNDSATTVLPDLIISDATLAEGALNANSQASALFKVSLSKASTSPVTVSYATQNGTAIAGQDFTAAQGTLTFAAGETSKTIAVPIINDTAVESTESFNVVLSNATQAKILDGTGVGTITDNDVAAPVLPNLVISDASLAEGALSANGQASALFKVSLSQASTSPVTVSYATQNGTAIAGQDFTAMQGTLTFAAGETSKTIAVPILNDTAVESTESFNVILSNATQAKITDSTGVGTITDNDAKGGTWDYLGFNYSSWWNGTYANAESPQALAQLKGVGADTATITSTYYLTGLKSSNIFATNNTESLANVEKAVSDAKSNGLSVWLKPHLDLTGGEFRGLLDPTDRTTFFSNYKKIILDYARLGQKYGVEALVLGTELNGVTKETDKAAWLDIISSVKQVYSGKLTYAANWDAPNKIPFVSQLDMIGVDAYYPLTQNNNASVDQLVSAWTSTPEDSFVKQLTGGQSIVDWLEGISKSTGKPIVFTEVGFRSADGNAAAPYAFWGQNTVDFTEQSRLYEAFFKVFGGSASQAGDVSWFDGAQLWNWYATATQNNDPTDTDYPILNKPAEAVFKQYASQLLSGSSAPSVMSTPTANPAQAPVLNTAPDPLTNPGALKYEFKVISDWGNGFSGDVLVTNTGNTDISQWALNFQAPYAISSAWNAQVNSLGSGQYQAKAIDSAPWNQVISPGETISFGFVGEAADPTSPTAFSMKTV
ncbi:MAG TPA: Calx-beta domain-containing protein, partial [Leptolyngbyaceae cyanobacterium]